MFYARGDTTSNLIVAIVSWIVTIPVLYRTQGRFCSGFVYRSPKSISWQQIGEGIPISRSSFLSIYATTRSEIRHLFRATCSDNGGESTSMEGSQQEQQQYNLPTLDEGTKERRHDDNDGQSTNKQRNRNKQKHIVFIRHGRTYMNDYINGIHFGGPNFTDIFEEKDVSKYRDSPLNDLGIQQSERLSKRLEQLRYHYSTCNDAGGSTIQQEKPRSKEEVLEDLLLPSDEHAQMLIDDIDLVVVSPLTRALQTLEIGLLPHLNAIKKTSSTKSNDGKIPIVAVPDSAERLYLISDIGKPLSELSQQYEYVDFQHQVAYDTRDDNDLTNNKSNEDVWHYNPTSTEEINQYVEWRPNTEGQQYYCLGEPQREFDIRMKKFYDWLERRNETCIVVISHHGVINWFTQIGHFENCELRIVPFDKLHSHT